MMGSGGVLECRPGSVERIPAELTWLDFTEPPLPRRFESITGKIFRGSNSSFSSSSSSSSSAIPIHSSSTTMEHCIGLLFLCLPGKYFEEGPCNFLEVTLLVPLEVLIAVDTATSAVEARR